MLSVFLTELLIHDSVVLELVEKVAAVDLGPEVAIVLTFVTTKDVAEGAGWVGAFLCW